MTEGGLYTAIDSYARQKRIAYIHLRNVTGKVPHYRETFIDDGDVDMLASSPSSMNTTSTASSSRTTPPK
jgi:D-mannonate dehydratase